MFTLAVCPHLDCPCVDVHLDGFLIDDRALDVVWERTGVRVSWPAGPGPGGPQEVREWALEAAANVDSGEVRPAEGAGEQLLLEWVRSEVDGELLEHLHHYWMTAKGFRMGAPRPDIDLGDRAPGERVGFEELFADERADGFVHEDRLYWAYSFFCPERDCRCDEVEVAFRDDAVTGGVSVGSVLLRLTGTAVEVLKIAAEDGAPKELVHTLWDRFRQRHRVAEHLARRQTRAKSVDPELRQLVDVRFRRSGHLLRLDCSAVPVDHRIHLGISWTPTSMSLIASWFDVDAGAARVVEVAKEFPPTSSPATISPPQSCASAAST